VVDVKKKWAEGNDGMGRWERWGLDRDEVKG
jgi:hypothetical protein